MSDFGARLREQRKAKGFQQQEALASALETNTETVGRWERGTSEPGIYLLCQLAELGMDVGYMLWGKKTALARADLTPQEEQLVALFRSIAPSDRDVAFRIVRGLVKQTPAEAGQDDDDERGLERHRRNTESWRAIVQTAVTPERGKLPVAYESATLARAADRVMETVTVWGVGKDRLTAFTASDGEMSGFLDLDKFRSVVKSKFVPEGASPHEWAHSLWREATSSLWTAEAVESAGGIGSAVAFVAPQNPVRFDYLSPAGRVVHLHLTPMYAGSSFFGGRVDGMERSAKVFLSYESVLGEIHAVDGVNKHVSTWRKELVNNQH